MFDGRHALKLSRDRPADRNQSFSGGVGNQVKMKIVTTHGDPLRHDLHSLGGSIVEECGKLAPYSDFGRNCARNGLTDQQELGWG